MAADDIHPADDTLPDDHDPEAVLDAERKMRAGATGIGDPDSPVPDPEHDPAAVKDAEHKMRGGASSS